MSAEQPIELLTTAEMGRADHLTVEAGTPGAILMDRAGSAVAVHCADLIGDARAGAAVLVLCGPGNNGGDGFVAARRLKASGIAVRVGLLGRREDLSPDAAEAARGWGGPVETAAGLSLDRATLIVDALYGAGLSRALDGEAAGLVERVNASGLPVVAVDVPSGIDGNTGAAAGPAIRAGSTVTFFRRKPGHLLIPGRLHCGACVLADIGIDGDVLDTIRPKTFANDPALWRAAYPWAAVAGHKYTRGHALAVSGGPTTSGAARMSARAALRIGAGLVTLASPSEGLAVCGAHLTAVMLRSSDGPDGLSALLADARKNAVVLGPGLGVGAATRALVERALAREPASRETRAVVLDADALASFAGDSAALAALVAAAPGPVVVTPHEGEFKRLFEGAGLDGPRLDRARRGADRLGAMMVLKGPDTVVAEPGGRASIAGADAPWLATAGSGDVLAGFVCGLLAQGMPAFEAASAAVWLHARTAARFGPGLIAEDLPDLLPGTLAEIRALRGGPAASRP